MPRLKQSEIFKNNYMIWKIFGIWNSKKPSKYNKYYSFIYLFFTLFTYNILLSLNLIYTPRTIEFMIREVIFYVTEIVVTSKVLMIFIMRDKIIEAFDLLDSEELNGDDDKSTQSIDRNYARYHTFWKMFAIMGNVAYISQVLLPILLHFIIKSNAELPISKYYFLTDEFREKYFILLFIYQAFGMYGHLMYNISGDTFIAGLLMVATTQCRVLNDKFVDIKLGAEEKNLSYEVQEQIQMARLKKSLRRYDFLLNYCNAVQKILDVLIFVQFGMSSIIICVALCALLLPSSTETYISMVMYLVAMMTQLFLPGYLGTQLSHESSELVFAAYNTEWIPRSESFKRSIRIFVEHANTPIQMTALKMFPLSLTTFTSIMKSAYSFFTLIRKFQTE